jgi:hypothetical protein
MLRCSLPSIQTPARCADQICRPVVENVAYSIAAAASIRLYHKPARLRNAVRGDVLCGYPCPVHYGYPRACSVFQEVGLVASVVTGLVLVPTYGALGAGLCILAGGIASLVALVVLRRQQKKGQESQKE